MYTDDEIRQLILDLIEGDGQRKVIAFKGVSKTTDIRFLTVAVKMLEEENDLAIESALIALQKLRKFRTNEILPQILPLLENPLYTANVLRIISEIGDKSIVPSLLQFLFSPDPKIRFATISLICQVDYAERLDILLFMLNDEDFDVSNNAVYGLAAYIHEDRVINVLLYHLTANDRLSPAAARTIGLAKYELAIEELKNAILFGSENLAVSALVAVVRIKGSSFEEFYIELAFKHPIERVRIASAYWIRRTLSHNQKALEALILMLQDDNVSYETQVRVVRELRYYSEPSALKAIEHWNKHRKREDDH